MGQELIIETTRWTTLPYLSQVSPVGLADFACIAELENVLHRHGATSRFGIHLLYKHFGLGPNEVLIERVDTERRILTSTVRDRSELLGARALTETHWRLGGGSLACDICTDGYLNEPETTG